MTISNFLDSYSLTARLLPTLLLVAPIYSFLLCFLGDGYGAFSISWGVLVVPLILILMGWTRRKGRQLQAKRENAEGLLSDRVLRLDPRALERAKVEQTFVTKLKLVFPVSTNNQLLMQTRDTEKFPVVNSEQKQYGFARNCLAIRNWIVGSLILQIVLCFIITCFDWPVTRNLVHQHFLVHGIICSLTGFIVLVLVTKSNYDAAEARFTEALFKASVIFIKEENEPER